MRTIEEEYLMGFHTPPENQGQIVESSYATYYDDEVVRRTVNHSDGSVSYSIATLDDDEDFEPWNFIPEIQGEWEPARMAKEENEEDRPLCDIEGIG